MRYKSFRHCKKHRDEAIQAAFSVLPRLARDDVFSFLLSLFLLVPLPALAQTAEQAKSAGLEFACPYLFNKARQTIAPMTQGKQGFFYRKSDFQEYFALLPDAENYLRRLTQAFASQGTKLVLLEVAPRTLAGKKFLVPSQLMQNTFDPKTTRASYAAYVDSLRTTGATVVPTLDLGDVYDDKIKMGFYFHRDMHWTPLAAQATAKRIAEVMQKELGYTPDESVNYRTKVVGTLPMKGVMYEELQQLCTDRLPDEIVPEYITSLEAGTGEDALFGDSSSTPPIVLLGSSFSWMSVINLEGFLAEALHRDIANFSIPGGALFNAITSYVSLPKEQKLAPEYVIWENLSHYTFNQGERLFRQIIPAVYSECSAEDAIATNTLEVKEGKGGVLFTLPEGKSISGPDYYLFIQSDNLGLVRFTLEMEYADGDGEWFTIDRSANFNNTGRFFAELTDEITAPLLKVTLNGMENVNAKVESRLCKVPASAQPQPEKKS